MVLSRKILWINFMTMQKKPKAEIYILSKEALIRRGNTLLKTKVNAKNCLGESLGHKGQKNKHVIFQIKFKRVFLQF